jgi:pimeloyl-ACP methyl ester carboxylesterase
MLHVRSNDGTLLALHPLHGSGDRALLIVHATGFSSQTYATMAHSITLPQGIQAIGLDLRSHGSSEVPSSPDHRWERFGDDVLSAISGLKELGISTDFAFGHSCGAAALLIAGATDHQFPQYSYLFEPIVSVPELYQPPDTPNPLSIGAARRRESFPSFTAAVEHYAQRPPLSLFDPSCLHDYVTSAFHRDGDGVTLNCPRSIESAIYANGAAHQTYSKLKSWRHHAVIAYGSVTEVFNEEHFRRLAAEMPHAQPEVVMEHGHFAPMEAPRSLAERLSTWLAGAALNSP